jgi:hypothetical protein
VCVVCCRCVLETRVCEVTVSCCVSAVCTANDSRRHGILYVFRRESLQWMGMLTLRANVCYKC